MARLLSPAGWFAATISGGSRMTSAAGATATVYADSAGTTLANIATYDGSGTPGPVITGSFLTVDSNSSLPRFWLPDGAEAVWVKVGTSPLTEVGADTSSSVPPAANYFNNGGLSQSFTSTSYADVTGASVTIVKTQGWTGLLVRINASGQSATTGFTTNYGVNIGGTDYSVTLGHIGQANIHVPQSGERRIAGIAAGSVTVQARCRVNGAGNTYTMNSSDAFTMTVQEVG